MLERLRKLLNLGKLAKSFENKEILIFYVGYGPGYDHQHTGSNDGTGEKVTVDKLNEIIGENYAFLRIGIRFKSEGNDSDVTNQVWLEYDTKKPEGSLYFSFEGSRTRKPEDNERILKEAANYLEEKL